MHAPPARACALQLAILPFLEERYRKYAFYKENILPFVCEFWSRSLEDESYQYKQPVLVKSKLQEILQSDNDGKEKAILRELVWSLDVRARSEAREWLSQDSK